MKTIKALKKRKDDPSRTIPESVRRQLRQEVGYRCPVPLCDSPFLEYHHFDPPWHEGLSHDPKGMIALCPRHHGLCDPKAKDHGWLGTEALRKLKSAVPLSPLRSRLEPLSTPLLLLSGGFRCLAVGATLSVFGIPRIGVRSDEHWAIVDGLCLDQDGEPIVEVRNCDIVLRHQSIVDAEFAPKSWEFRVDAGKHGKIKAKFVQMAIADVARMTAIGILKDPMQRDFAKQMIGPHGEDVTDWMRHLRECELLEMTKRSSSADLLPVLMFWVEQPIVDRQGRGAALVVDPWHVYYRLSPGADAVDLGFRICKREPYSDRAYMHRINQSIGMFFGGGRMQMEGIDLDVDDGEPSSNDSERVARTPFWTQVERYQSELDVRKRVLPTASLRVQYHPRRRNLFSF